MNEETRNFVRQHRHDDVRRLALQGVKGHETDLPLALQQIAGWQTASKKLPTWARNEGVLYPPHLNMEQCSSEQTARYKQRLAGRLMGRQGDSSGGDTDEMGVFVDLTGGLGVDFYWMSQGFKERRYVEQNADLCTLAEHNFRELGLPCSVDRGSASVYLAELTRADVIYLDPARRDDHGGRTYGISDCTPDVLQLLPTLLEKARYVVVKLSPMLDWRKAVSDLGHVQEVHIVSVDNECKELLLVVSYEQKDSLKLFCVNNDTVFHVVSMGETDGFHGRNRWFPQEKPMVSAGQAASPIESSSRHGYLYEPNSSIMKAGCFLEVEQQYPVRQLSANSHLFTSAVEIGDFPGRRFLIQAVSSMNKQELKTTLADVRQANISVRNFPLTAEQLRRKLKLKDGGEAYIFATTLADGQHRLLICRKIG